MFIAHRIRETVGGFYCWSFGSCLSEAHAVVKGRACNGWVSKLVQKAKEIHRVNARYAIAKGIGFLEYWKECYMKAWEILKRNWEFRLHDENSNIARAVQARLKSQRLSQQYFVNQAEKNRMIFRR